MRRGCSFGSLSENLAWNSCRKICDGSSWMGAGGGRSSCCCCCCCCCCCWEVCDSFVNRFDCMLFVDSSLGIESDVWKDCCWWFRLDWYLLFEVKLAVENDKELALDSSLDDVRSNEALRVFTGNWLELASLKIGLKDDSKLVVWVVSSISSPFWLISVLRSLDKSGRVLVSEIRDKLAPALRLVSTELKKKLIIKFKMAIAWLWY